MSHVLVKIKKAKSAAAICSALGCLLLFWWLDYHGEYIVNDGGVVKEVAGVEEDDREEDFTVTIKTDALDITAPVFDGRDLDTLARGLGHEPATAYPGTHGNVVISGHRWYPGSNPYYKIFEDLDQLRAGDHIQTTFKGKTYTYKVRSSEIVPDDALEILQHTDAPQLTLYTCTPKYTSKDRLVYVADLAAIDGVPFSMPQ